MNRVITLLVSLLFAPLSLAAESYTFTPNDYIEYGIYFSARGSSTNSHKNLLTLRYGDIEAYYANVLKNVSKVPTPKQALRLSTRRGSVRVNRNDNIGVTVTRDTHNERRRTGTKRLEIRFENASCTDRAGVTSPCVADLLLVTERPDKGVVRQPRTLSITTSTGLTFRYRSVRVDGGKPLNLPLLRRTPSINNYAWEWRRPRG